jgi:hypothetical protein
MNIGKSATLLPSQNLQLMEEKYRSKMMATAVTADPVVEQHVTTRTGLGLTAKEQLL